MTRRASIALLFCMLGCLPLLAQEAGEETEWLAQEAAGALSLESNTSVLLRGVTGSVEVRTSKGADDLRWSSAGRGRQAELPLRVGESRSGIVLMPPEGDLAPRGIVLIVPARVSVRIEARAAQVLGSRVESRVTAVGEDLDVRLQGAQATVELELTRGTVIVEAPQDQLTVRGTPTSVKVINSLGRIVLGLASSAVQLSGVGAGLEADLQDTKLEATTLRGHCRVTARGGSLRLLDLGEGGDFDLTGSPLVLEAPVGEVSVRSDAEVQFTKGRANLHVRGIAASVRGSENRGLVEVETDSAEVILAKIDGPLRVRGNSLKLRLEDTAGETGLITSGSTVEVSKAGGPLSIENDFGDVTIRDATAKVEVKNRDGDVTLLGLQGQAVVVTQSKLLTVGWTILPSNPEFESVLENGEGDIRVELPPGGQVLVEATSHYGRVESALDWVRVADDGRSAKGLLGRGRTPRLRIEAEGGVMLAGQGAAARETEPEAEPEAEPQAAEEER